MTMTRRDVLLTLASLPLAVRSLRAAGVSVTTLLGTGVAGYSDTQVNNPYGIIFGPDSALYFCDLDNQRIRRFDPKTKIMARTARQGKAPG